MKNILFLMMLCVSVTPIAFKYQLQNDMEPIKRGRLEKDGQPLNHATTNLITTHTA